MGHLGAPPLTDGLDESNPIAKAFGGVYNNLWSGPAAVIVFFVISGFCIHYPYASSLRISSIGAYAVRRYLRIGIPLAVAIGVSAMMSVNLSIFNDSILWSLVAELIYYTLYPALLIVRRRTLTWSPMIFGAFALGLVLASTNPTAGNYPSFGNALNWILGLPCWLSGCWLADAVVKNKIPESMSYRSIWIWRGLILVLAMVCSILRFHTPLGYPWTLNLFGFVVVFWLAREITWFMASPTKRWLEWAGAWSYSVYLFHVLAMPIYMRYDKPNFGVFFNWLFMMTFVMISSYLFYLLIEYPGHLAARHAGKILEGDQGKSDNI
jgi:peptidoglycan/LPS O-acetylase OafA/YrhL